MSVSAARAAHDLTLLPPPWLRLRQEHRYERNQDVNTELLALLEEFGPASKKDIYAKLDEDGGELRAKLGSNNRVKGLLNDLRVFKLVRARGRARVKGTPEKRASVSVATRREHGTFDSHRGVGERARACVCGRWEVGRGRDRCCAVAAAAAAAASPPPGSPGRARGRSSNAPVAAAAAAG